MKEGWDPKEDVLRCPRPRRGIPYSVTEACLVVKDHAMDPYHRELMQFLIAEIARLSTLLEEKETP